MFVDFSYGVQGVKKVQNPGTNPTWGSSRQSFSALGGSDTEQGIVREHVNIDMNYRPMRWSKRYI